MAVVPQFDERGLVPCIVQDAVTGTVLMLAWMNAEALELTRTTREVTFWSRSRRALWKKGETSGNTLALVELRIDCDRDCVLARVTPAGPACHTGAATCFFTLDDGAEDSGIPASRSQILSHLDRVLAARRDAATPEKSYTRSLLDAGMPKILSKIAEEHDELAAELPGTDDPSTIHEAADLLFHVMVGLTARELSIDAVLDELGRRFGTSGHVEKASRT
jgi:phosphoribosyl-ATP pyrophosphohydrolase/phosphoribosyl-AMP cyclohydrolase